MRVSYDLHIHSVLSPCAERDMTPNNIVNMAFIKELDFIAITDHNAIQNVKAAMKVAESLPITVIPGIEVQTKEDVHLVCLFRSFEKLTAFYCDIVKYLTIIPHDKKRFGLQSIMDHKDIIIGELDYSLYASVQLSVDMIIEKVLLYGGGVLPAHLDRQSYSMISNLGFIAPELPLKAIELSSECDVDNFIKSHRYLKKYKILINSDAHELYRISEPVHIVEIADKTIEAFFSAVFGG